MKIEKVSLTDYSFFINSEYYNNINYNEQDDIIKLVKDIILKYKDILNLGGFYKVKVYPVENIGIYIYLNIMDTIELSSNIDLRVIVNLNKKVYFKTEDYFCINGLNNIKYLNKFYYINIRDLDNINRVIEFGKFILEDEVNLSRAITIGGI